jgi:hypothetical protein
MSANVTAEKNKNVNKQISFGMKVIVSVAIGKNAMTLSWHVYGNEICSGKMMTASAF